MSQRDAFEDEVSIRTLSDQEAERLLQGHAPETSELAELAEFARALRQTLPARPAGVDPNFARQLAETARSGIAGVDGETVTMPIATVLRSRGKRSRPARPRLATVGWAAAAVLLVPVVCAGLAVAGVTLPEPARSAFEAVGVELPNQPPPDDEQGTEAVEEAAGKARQRAVPGDFREKATEKGTKSSAARRGQGRAKSNPAREGGRANGAQGRGRALGKRGLAPGQLKKLEQSKTGGGGKAIGKTNGIAPGESSKPSSPSGQAKASSAQGGGGKGVKAIKLPKRVNGAEG